MTTVPPDPSTSPCGRKLTRAFKAGVFAVALVIFSRPSPRSTEHGGRKLPDSSKI